MDSNTSVLQMHGELGTFKGFHRLTLLEPEKQNNDTLRWLWDRVKTQDYAFDDFSRDKAEWFLYQLADLNCRYLLIDKVGLFIVQTPVEGGNAGIHFIVWDRNFSIHQDKEPAYELLDWLFYELKVHRIEGKIPVYNKLAPRFAVAMGMKYEGEMREAVLWKGRYYGVAVYGMLEREYHDRRERLGK